MSPTPCYSCSARSLQPRSLQINGNKGFNTRTISKRRPEPSTHSLLKKHHTKLRTFVIEGQCPGHFCSHSHFKLNADFFGGCEALEVLKITKTMLEDIPQDLFRDAKNLKEVDLSRNRIKSLPDNTFHSDFIHRLERLDLSGNRIMSIDELHFNCVPFT